MHRYGVIDHETRNFQTCFREAAASNLGPVTGWNLEFHGLSQSLLKNIGTFFEEATVAEWSVCVLCLY
jgi:hypothetical protein